MEAMEDLEVRRTEYEGCSHYKRKCRLVAPCCDGVYSCRCVSQCVILQTLFYFH